MNHKNIGFYFFLAILFGVVIVSFLIFRPFVYPLILAAVFATVFLPMHNKVLAIIRNKKTLAAILSTLLVLLIVIVPLTFLGFQILREASGLYAAFTQENSASQITQNVNDAIHRVINLSPVPINFVADINAYLSKGLDWLMQHLGQIFLNVANILIDTLIFLIALFYLFKDGQRLKKAIVIFSPLKDDYDESIISKLALAVKSVVGGNIVVAIVQGILTAVGFLIFGVPNAVLWGSVAMIASLVPTVGTSLVLVPAILYLIFTGKIVFALGLLVWGFFAVGLIDNYLGPKIASRGMQIHPLMILLSVLGGITLFGPIGFILGPLILCLLGALIDIYFLIRKEREGY